MTRSYYARRVNNTNRRTESTPILYYQLSYRVVPSLRCSIR